MTSRSPAKARTIRAEFDQAAEPDQRDRYRLWRNLTATALRLSRHTAALSFVTLAVFVAMTLLEFFYFRRLSGGLPSLDMRLAGFTPDEGMAWLTALGRRGGEIILVWHYLTFDLLFPALLSLTLLSLLLVTGRRLAKFRTMAAPAQSLLALVLVLPYTLADYAQNLAVARLLSDFQSANPDSLAFASALTVTKFALLGIPVGVIAVFYLADQRQAGQGGERP
ncbi:MAG: hypothetical protein EOS58_24035 [Mesorhizobium sp.]|uniref:hypothetical protein n=2 Tax=Mesorhizobium TaxID=68287 RepID=UPI000F74ED57|nr:MULTISPECIES: hypothetical protein [unclassified Mesorhizobium]AZO47518.1 hypothetical protein EJ073_06430 [Mesorhizobium sp. M4B.F.Ca.ET.058.02.1.1]RVC41261.1 hypothetical protein EN781_26735 [Mesorhizobium sp. M4A.F.Ca.ET.090.04.2.1]RWC56026.1 MAG: hypothetical protein EOS54_07505 [Mesorhizobium sp.]RWD01896.1 MAG: hypothetical protein EOS58_24035 [Mesorhizobium sp.]RWD13302.1 MAG: hypothetical protein EOS74_21220 [Mesorhizobium sp.]